MIGYSFPNTDGPQQRTVHLVSDDSLVASISPTEASGIWTLPFNFTCLRGGSHYVKARAVACNGWSKADFERWSNAVTADIVSRPTANPTYSGPDEFGHGTLTVDYNFPNTDSASQRAINVVSDDQLMAEFSPTSQSGTWTIPFDVTCWRKGQHYIKTRAVSCNHWSDPDYEYWSAPINIDIDSRPEATPTYSGPDELGHGTLTVAYKFPNTAGANQRVIHVVSDDQLIAEFSPPTRTGTWTLPFNVTCMTGDHYIKTRAVACNHWSDPDFEHWSDAINVAPDHKPSAQITDVRKNESGVWQAIVHYHFPQTDNASQRSLRLEWQDNGALIGTVAPGQVEGDWVVDLPACVPGELTTLRVIAIACGDQRNSSSRAAGLPECDNACSVECADCFSKPIRSTNGNMRFSDADPLPGEIVTPLARTYNSRDPRIGRFGRGWSSIFDAHLTARGGADGGETVRLITATSDVYAFEQSGGAYVQTYPAGERVPSVLTYDAARGLFVHRHGGSATEELYRAADGRLVGVSSRREALQVEIAYATDATPQRVSNSRANWAWTFSVDAAGRIAQIAVEGRSDLTWTYGYDADGNLTTVTAPANAPWRTYTYGAAGMLAAYDAQQRLIESHAYDSDGRAVSTASDRDDVSAVSYGLAGRVAGELMTRVTYTSGRTTDYYSRFVGGKMRTVQVDGSCDCGTDDTVYGYDTNGRIIREQDARGYITVRQFDESSGRLISVGTSYRPVSCDPATDSTRCRLDPSTILTTTLQATAATDVVQYTYGDAAWPDRPTSMTRTSVLAPAQVTTTSSVFDPSTGVTLQETISGWTNRGAGNVVETRTTTRALYDGAETALFDPCGGASCAFSPSWLALPQPSKQIKLVDGPRDGVSDQTTLVYYPVHASVPALLRGRLAASRNGAGHIVRFEAYDVFGNATRVVDPNGVATETAADALGRVLTTTIKATSGCDTTIDPLCADDLVAARTYALSSGALANTRLPGGGVSVYAYDVRGRITMLSRGADLNDLRERLEYEYDDTTGEKRLERWLSYENGGWVEKKRETYHYDAVGNLSEVVHGDGTAVHYAYDAQRHVVGVRDERHSANNTTYAYDPAGRISTVTQTLGSGQVVTRYAYDLRGNLASVTDPNGNVTTYKYDDFGQLLQQTSPVTGTTTYAYDPAGNLTRTVDANGSVSVRSFDALGRVISATSSRLNATDSVQWTYDENPNGVGRLSGFTDPSGQASFRYDRRGLLLRETKQFGAETYVTTYGYDADGNRNRIVYPSGRTATYSFDYAGRPLTAAVNGAPLVLSASYLPFGPVTATTYGNGTARTATYDARYQLLTNALATASGAIASYTYTHDAVGNVTGIHDVLAPGYDRTFGYDDLNRLTSANTGDALWGTATYSYDPMGNLLTSSLGSLTKTFNYANASPKLTAVATNGAPQAVTYDAAGNETVVGPEQFVYGPRNLLVRNDNIEYAYDARGVRVTQKSDVVRVASLSLNASRIRGGEAGAFTIALSGPAPAGGVVVAVTSSSALVTVPSTVTIAAGETSASVPFTSVAVSQATTVHLTATHFGDISQDLVLTPSCLVDRVEIHEASVTGGQAAHGVVYLFEQAPTGGTEVTLASNAGAAVVPPSVVIAAGQSSAEFPIATTPVTADTTARITASLCGSVWSEFSVAAPSLATLVLQPAAVESGAVTTATVTLTGAAPAGGIVVLTSTSDSTLATVPSSIVIAAGQSAGSFAVTTRPIDEPASVIVSASRGNVTKSATLDVARCTFDDVPPTLPSDEIVWFDDAPPAGAVLHESWTWDTTKKASGVQSMDIPLANGYSGRWFENATNRLVVAAGDRLFVYVLVDPCHPPREIILGWSDGAVDQRAYWGEDLLPFSAAGTGRVRMGDVPEGGEWVRLEVPDSTLHLAGRSLSAMALDIYGGRAWFDRAGRIACNPAPAPPPVFFPDNESVWFDDAVPAGAITHEVWTWDTVQRASGTASHVVNAPAGAGGHWFENASTTLTVLPGEALFVYAYLDPCNPPREIMLGWNDGSWEHRTYWGENLMPYASPSGMFRIGDLPRQTGWVRLEMPADFVNLAGKTISGMAFDVYGGRAWFDRVGKMSCEQPHAATPPPASDEVLWVDDSLPSGAVVTGSLEWDSAEQASGNSSLVVRGNPGAQGVWFWQATAMTPSATENLMVHVLIDPCDPPREIMVGWYDGSWEHRAYWGENLMPYATPAGMTKFGEVPVAGEWVTLEIPASALNLSQHAISGIALDVYGGRVWFDRIGKRACAPTIAAPAPFAPGEEVWFDDSVPSGAVTHGEWTWDATQKTSGSSSHTWTSFPEWSWHWFEQAGSGMTLNAGDNLFVYALIDPCDPPREIMLGWFDGTSWDHRAYFGENLMHVAPAAAEFGMGAVPEGGQWVRLEVPATIANLAGRTVTGMAFDVFGGKVWFDRAGKYSCAAGVAPRPADDTEERVWVEDRVPNGARYYGPWEWDTNQKAGGTRSHFTPPLVGWTWHYFEEATETPTVGADDELFAWVLVDPCDPPRSIMLGWNDGTWDHRAYWGEDLFPVAYGGLNRVRVGDVPVAGQWVKLRVSAERMGLAGKTLNGMDFDTWGGKVWFDRAGAEEQNLEPMSADALPPPMTSSTADRRVTSASTTERTLHYLYSPELSLIAETDSTGNPNGAVTWEYIWFNGQPLAQIENATGAIAWYFNDHLGTPLLQTDAASNVIWRAEYEPYGTVHTLREGPNRHQPLRFPGQEAEDLSDRSYNIFRWYRAGWGRYTQADPIGVVGREFPYASDNPIFNSDMLGLLDTGALLRRPVTRAVCEVAGETAGWLAGRAAGLITMLLSASDANPVEFEDQIRQCDTCVERRRQCDELNTAVEEAKRHVGDLGACRAGMSRWELQQRYSAWLALATARARRDVKCWRGGDSGHQQAQADAWSNVGNCARLLGL
jgi:RHS repeat-associated protein